MRTDEANYHIPEETQFALLAHHTSRDIADKVKESSSYMENIRAISCNENEIEVLGQNDINDSSLLLYMQKNDISNGELISKDKFKRVLMHYHWHDLKNPLTLFGYTMGTIFTLTILPIYSLMPGVRRRARKEDGWDEKFKTVLKENTSELEKHAENVAVYQTSMREVQEELKRPLERVDTGSLVQCLRSANTAHGREDNSVLWLRAQAGMLGADAIVHYAPGSAIGTPVRYK